jgi:hypothetical protein
MNIHVLDQSFNFIGLIDDYVSVIWRPAYYDIGDFELYLNASVKAVNLLKKNYYLVRESDIVVDSEGNVTYTNVMIIKNFTVTTDEENGDYITVTGRELKYLLHQRIVWTQTNLTGTAEDAIRRLVTENAISPTDSNRVIPTLTLGVSAGLTDTIEKQVTGDHLDQTIVDICTAYNYGWEIFIYNSALVLIIYQGVDRSFNQTERPYVVFSEDFDNITKSTYELNSEEYANTTLIGGEGEGTERVYVTVGADKSGLDRFEVFTDAKDLSQNKDSETDAIPLSTYKTLLQERGHENLASLGLTEGFSGEVLETNFKYGIDYYMGDTVTIINKYGMSKDVRVLSVIESVDDTGAKILPQFNM